MLQKVNFSFFVCLFICLLWGYWKFSFQSHSHGVLIHKKMLIFKKCVKIHLRMVDQNTTLNLYIVGKPEPELCPPRHFPRKLETVFSQNIFFTAYFMEWKSFMKFMYFNILWWKVSTSVTKFLQDQYYALAVWLNKQITETVICSESSTLR